MGFRIERRGDTLVVGVPGPLVVANRQELKEWVLDQLEKGERYFLIDFSETGYIDSSGLGVLVTLRKRLVEQGGRLRLGGLSADMRRVMELAGIHRIFPSDEWDEPREDASRAAPLPPQTPGPLQGAAEAQSPDEDEEDTPTR